MSNGRKAGSLWDDQFRAIFDSSLDAVITIDASGRIVDWSRQATATFGWTPEEVLGVELAGILVPDEYQVAHRAGLERFRETGEAPVVGQRLELVARRRDGTIFPIELSVTKLEKSGKTYFTAFVRDISDWHREEARQSRRMLEAELISETMSETVTAVSFEDSLQVVLAAICDQIKWPLGHVWLPDDSNHYLVSTRIWHNDSRLEVEDFRRVTEASRLRRGEGLPGTIWRTGQPQWIDNVIASPSFPRAQRCNNLPLRTAFGFPVLSNHSVVAILEFFHTEPIQEDDELLKLVARLGNRVGGVVQARRFEHQQAKLAAIVDSSYDAIIGKAMDGTITSWNAGAERVYGYSEDDALGQTGRIMLPDDLKAEEPEILLAIQTGQRLEQFQTTRKRKDGTLIPVSITVSPIADSSGRIVGTSTIERDISIGQRREKELHAAKQVAVRANRARGEFLANVSHELRTPMNAIIGMTQIALEEELTPALRDYLETANEAAHSLLTLLNDILDFSKLESGKFTISKEPFSLTDVVDETVKTLSTQAFSKGLEVVCEMPPHLPREVLGDPMRLRQILTNLLSNAIKFTERGEIVLRVQVARTWPTEIALRFSVRDTGIGVPPEYRQRILEPFTQVDSSSTRQRGGTGLGLAICAELLRLMGGRLSLQSALDEGSTFSFRLSFDLPTDPTRDSVDGSLLERLHDLPVLVVDDNGQTPQKLEAPIDLHAGDPLASLSVLVAEDTPANQKVVTTVLKKRGHSVTVADNGREAVEHFKKEAFDVVLMDIQMPILNGYQATAAIREFERKRGTTTPIIAMTAHAMRGDREKCLESGMDAYIAKPLNVKQLLGLIESITEDGETDPEPPTPPQADSHSSTLVLDYADAMKRLGNDTDLFREFIGFYDEDSRLLLSQIEAAIESGDAGQLLHAAHSLKGLAANLGALRVVRAAFSLENTGKSGTMSTSPNELTILRNEMTHLDQSLQVYRD
ncbi:MAG TPA: PAS domain S-box protein [Pirellulaceae bacterium]|nr:PAS domain S-box protein [Pirellulaceae bacterium]